MLNNISIDGYSIARFLLINSFLELVNYRETNKVIVCIIGLRMRVQTLILL